MADCFRKNGNPEKILAILPTVGRVCFINCSLFGMSGVGYHTLVCLKSVEDCHLMVHSLSMLSLSSLLIALLAVSPMPSTEVLGQLIRFLIAKDSYVGLNPF
jgi:hypothetical protein